MIRSFKGIKQENSATDDFDRILYPNQGQPLCRATELFQKGQFFSSVKYALVAFHTARPDVDAPPGHATLTIAENPQEISATQNPPVSLHTAGLHCRSGITVHTDSDPPFAVKCQIFHDVLLVETTHFSPRIYFP